MSIVNIKNALNSFLKTDTPEVFAIRGAWGVGKTYSWNKFIQEAKVNGQIKLKKYSYVSLFGINDLEMLKFAILRQYGYNVTDEFDLELARIVETGFIDEERLLAKAKIHNEKIVASKSEKSFRKAWRLYHDTFENNEDELVNGLYESFKQNSKYITPNNLNATVKLLRNLDKDQKADELIEIYIETNKHYKEIFDLNSYPFSGDIILKKNHSTLNWIGKRVRI